MASLADIRARIAAQENKSGNNGSTKQSDNSIYPHWNMDEGTTASIRFLPDANGNNTFFWVERQIIKLPFNGVKGDPNVKQIQVQVPCVEMYNDGSSCPILAEVRPWYKDESLKEMANKYWKKRSYIFQGFVRQNPIGDDATPANPIRKFIISPQIFTIIKSSLMDPEMEELPTDFMRGVDFRIAKTSKGGFADYSTSKWSRRERALSDAEKAAIDTHGLYNLSDFLPKKPTDVELKVMKEMFEASVDGEAYDMERWGQYFKPAGMGSATGDPNKAAAPRAAATPVDEDIDDTPAPIAAPAPRAEASTSSEGTSRAQDILAKIRARQPQ